MLGIAEAAPNRVASFFAMNGEDNHLTREYLSGNSPGEMRRGMSPYSIVRHSVRRALPGLNRRAISTRRRFLEAKMSMLAKRLVRIALEVLLVCAAFQLSGCAT